MNPSSSVSDQIVSRLSEMFEEAMGKLCNAVGNGSAKISLRPVKIFLKYCQDKICSNQYIIMLTETGETSQFFSNIAKHATISTEYP